MCKESVNINLIQSRSCASWTRPGSIVRPSITGCRPVDPGSNPGQGAHTALNSRFDAAPHGAEKRSCAFGFTISLREEGKQGYESRAEAVRTAVRQFLEEHEIRPRLETLDITEAQTLLRDNLLSQTVRIYSDDRGLFCELCESDNCIHTRCVHAVKHE